MQCNGFQWPSINVLIRTYWNISISIIAILPLWCRYGNACFSQNLSLNSVQERFFWDNSRMGGQKASPHAHKICHTFSTMMKLSTVVTKEDPKNIWIMWYNPWVLLTGFLHQKSEKLAISRNTGIGCIFIHIF